MTAPGANVIPDGDDSFDGRAVAGLAAVNRSSEQEKCAEQDRHTDECRLTANPFALLTAPDSGPAPGPAPQPEQPERNQSDGGRFGNRARPTACRDGRV